MPVVHPRTPTVCLVGAPNVGKSSLVRILSSGKPEVCLGNTYAVFFECLHLVINPSEILCSEIYVLPLAVTVLVLICYSPFLFSFSFVDLLLLGCWISYKFFLRCAVLSCVSIDGALLDVLTP